MIDQMRGHFERQRLTERDRTVARLHQIQVEEADVPRVIGEGLPRTGESPDSRRRSKPDRLRSRPAGYSGAAIRTAPSGARVAREIPMRNRGASVDAAAEGTGGFAVERHGPPAKGLVMRVARVWALMAALSLMLGALGLLAGGPAGLLAGLAVATLLNGYAFFAAPSLVLRGYGARLVDEAEAPALHALVGGLCKTAGLPVPRLAIAPYPQPNAFVVGRDPGHAVLCVTEELLAFLDGDQLAAVIAHELGHLMNEDVFVRTFAAAVAGTTGDPRSLGTLLGGPPAPARHPIARLVSVALAPLNTLLVRLAIRRNREFDADEVAAGLTGQPHALASALRKLDPMARIPTAAPLAISLLAQVDPSTRAEIPRARHYATHPSVQERMERLEALALRAEFREETPGPRVSGG
jgi:heat shock protein HtpX